MNLEENIQLKDQFKKKCDQVQEMYENLFKEAQNYKREMVGVDEIKKDRDHRVSQLREEIDALTVRLDTTSADYASLKVEFSNLKDEHTRLNNDYAVLGKNLHLSNEVRKQKEDSYFQLEKQYKIMKDSFVEKDIMM